MLSPSEKKRNNQEKSLRKLAKDPNLPEGFHNQPSPKTDDTILHLTGDETQNEPMDQDNPPHEDEAVNLAALWGKLRHWAG